MFYVLLYPLKPKPVLHLICGALTNLYFFSGAFVHVGLNFLKDEAVGNRRCVAIERSQKARRFVDNLARNVL